jgi:drug/metabolite transporter (DMT)-like permease
MKEKIIVTDNLRGILFLIASVTCFGIVDGLSKMLIETQSFGQVVLARYALALPVLLAATHPGKWKSLFQTQMAGWQIVRGLIPAVIGGSMVLAVKYLPLAEATVILFASPFLVLALSGWLLGEQVSGASWIGVAVDFIAVLIVARPGFSELSQYTIFPVIAAVFYAGFQLLTRWLGTLGEAPTTTLAWTLSVGVVVGLPLAMANWAPQSLETWLLSICLGVVFGFAQLWLAKAFSLAPANLLTPFSYFQILSAVVFGVLVFHDIPDYWTLTGIALIVGAGLYVFGRSAAGSKARFIAVGAAL